jgi:hypothetical protein
MVLAHALAHRGAGLGLGQHGLAGAIAFGALAIVNGALHLIHVDKYGASGSDITGVADGAAAGSFQGGQRLSGVAPRRRRPA